MPDKREPVTIDGESGRVIPQRAQRGTVTPPRYPPQPAPVNVHVFVQRVAPAVRADVLAARIVEGAAGEVEREIKRAVRRFFRG